MVFPASNLFTQSTTKPRTAQALRRHGNGRANEPISCLHHGSHDCSARTSPWGGEKEQEEEDEEVNHHDLHRSAGAATV